jgi:hypothetical protein
LENFKDDALEERIRKEEVGETDHDANLRLYTTGAVDSLKHYSLDLDPN